MNQKILWIVTAIIAIAMLMGAVFIARQKTAPVSGPIAPQSSAIVSEAPSKPVTPIVSVTPQVAQEPEPSKSVVYDEVKVDISKIAGTLKMSSADIPAAASGGLPRYPLELTCYRKNASPAINWYGAPSATTSYVLVLERRAPNEKASWSWIMFNIPASSTGLPGKIDPETLAAGQGFFGANPYGHNAYTGPCEPKGVYPYVLRLFALDNVLPLQTGATLQQVLPAMNGHVIDAAEIHVEHYLKR